MAGIKEIRTRIDSVQQTLKITNAMYLISSSKLRRARQQLNSVQPYFMKISSTIADILHHSPEIEHIYFDKRPERKHRRAGYIVITGDKGLAGRVQPQCPSAGRGATGAGGRPHAVPDRSDGTRLLCRARHPCGRRVYVHGAGPDDRSRP